jgi:hypothetical protein
VWAANSVILSFAAIVGVLKQVLGGKVWREWRLTLPKIPETEQRSAGLAFKLDEFRTIAMQLL